MTLHIGAAIRATHIDRATAIHEAGHAWVAHLLGVAVPRVHATTGGAGFGWTSVPEFEDADPHELAPGRVDAYRVLLAAGRAAEIVWMVQGGATHAAAIDQGSVSDLAVLADLDQHGVGRLDADTAEDRAIDLVHDTWDDVVTLADRLQEAGGALGSWWAEALPARRWAAVTL